MLAAVDAAAAVVDALEDPEPRAGEPHARQQAVGRARLVVLDPNRATRFGYDKRDIRGIAAMGPVGWFFRRVVCGVVCRIIGGVVRRIVRRIVAVVVGRVALVVVAAVAVVAMATEVGVKQPLGLHTKKVGVDLDVVATRFVGPLFLRLGVGASTLAYAPVRDPFKPGVGGLVGVGWEFRIAERVGLALGLDYDVRARADRQFAQTFLFGLRLNGYPKK